MSTKKLRHAGFALFFMLLFAACHPYTYHMGDYHSVDARVITSLHSVDQGAFVSTLHDSGAVSISSFGVTQYNVTLNTRLKSGEGFRIMVRPVVEQWYVRDSGIVFTLSKSGFRVDSSGVELYKNAGYRLRPDVSYPMSIFSENNYYYITLGCDTLYHGWTSKKESDDIVFQSLPKSDLEISNPQWDGLDYNLPGH